MIHRSTPGFEGINNQNVWMTDFRHGSLEAKAGHCDTARHLEPGQYVDDTGARSRSLRRQRYPQLIFIIRRV